MTVYAIANANIFDAEKYNDYLTASAGLIAKHNGRLLVASRNSEVLEGDPGILTVVIEFPTEEDAKAWYNSPGYTEARKFRRQPDVSEGWLLIAPQTEKR